MKCLDEGTLRAYHDGELAEDAQCAAAGHLAGCAGCRRRLERLETAVRRVDELLDTLAPEDAAAIRRARPGRRWAAGTLAAALAAGLVMLLGTRAPSHVAAPIAARMPVAVAPQPVRQDVALKAARVHRHRRPEPPLERGLDGFVLLAGADPMQMGMVVRVMVPVADVSAETGVRQVAADLVIGEDGRARAIRFVE